MTDPRSQIVSAAYGYGLTGFVIENAIRSQETGRHVTETRAVVHLVFA
ncbi:MAG: hypothetical protein PGN29_15410 [Gordonia paraffinivorans]